MQFTIKLEEPDLKKQFNWFLKSHRNKRDKHDEVEKYKDIPNNITYGAK